MAVLSHLSTAPSLTWILILVGLAWVGWAGLKSLTGGWLMGGTILLHVLALGALPLWEDDGYRYLWDGYQLVQTGNPYGRAPADFFGRTEIPEVMQRVLDRVNHPDVPTIYGPMAEYAFALAAFLAPGSLVAWKVLVGLVDLILFTFLWFRISPETWRRWAWCPLWWWEGLINAHVDVIGVAFLAWALGSMGKKRDAWAGLALAGMVGTKLALGVLLPVLWWPRRSPRIVLGFLAGGALLYLPFWLRGSTTEWTAICTMGAHWEFNSLGFALVKYCLGDEWARKMALALTAGLLLTALVFLKKWGLNRAGLVVWGAFLVFSPVVNPWYLLWLLPLTVDERWCTPWVAMAVVGFSYVTVGNLGEGLSFEHPIWVRPLEGLLILTALGWDLAKNKIVSTRFQSKT
jgi:hypothetical protein